MTTSQASYAEELPTITEIQTGGGYVSLESGFDNKLWAIQADYYGRIWQLSLNGEGNYYSLGSSSTYPLGNGITKGPDGAMWFTEIGANKIGRINVDGQITEYTVPTNFSRPHDITKGSDGNLWFTEQHGNNIGRITPNGIITEFPLPREFSYQFSYPQGITAGSDGNIWFTEYGTNKIGRITTNGFITEFLIPTLSSNNPHDITAGPDGNMWFTQGSIEANKIGRITPEGIITEYKVPTSNSRPYNIVSGPDGKLWFTEHQGNKIGSITVEGVITEFIVPTINSNPSGIAVGPDNNIWFTEANNNKIGRVNLTDILFPTPSPTTPVSSGTLNVPYFSQNVSPWGPTEYDHTIDLKVSGIGGSMDRWGCAVTSVAMVLNYHNMKQFPDGTAIDPGSLNTWLKNNKGYAYGYGKDGWYSSVIWNSIAKLTRELKTAGKAPYKLEWNRAYPSTETTALLNHDLTEGNELGKIPNILFVNNRGHFIVAKGKIGDTYTVNDPEWNYPTLTSFNNTYSQVDRYVPSNTDLSYIVAVINPDVEILLTDSQNQKVGKTVKNGQAVVYNEISNASYTYEPSVSNPNELGTIENLGTGVNILLLPKPADGEYTITLSGNINSNYTLNLSTFEDDGDSELYKTEGLVSPNESTALALHYSQTKPAAVASTVTFQSIIADVNQLFALDHIHQQSVANSLIRNIEQAEKATLAGNTNKILQNLNQFIAILERERGKKLNERAYAILNKEAELLK